MTALILLSAAVSYLCGMLALSAMFSPRRQGEQGRGKALLFGGLAHVYLLAHDNPFFGSPFCAELILGRSAPAAALETFLMAWLTGCFLGALLTLLNPSLRQETGALTAGAICVLDFVLYACPDQIPALFWLSPVSWMNPQQYTGPDHWKLPIRAGLLALLFVLICLLRIQRLGRRQIEMIHSL